MSLLTILDSIHEDMIIHKVIPKHVIPSFNEGIMSERLRRYVQSNAKHRLYTSGIIKAFTSAEEREPKSADEFKEFHDKINDKFGSDWEQRAWPIFTSIDDNGFVISSNDDDDVSFAQTVEETVLFSRLNRLLIFILKKENQFLKKQYEYLLDVIHKVGNVELLQAIEDDNERSKSKTYLQKGLEAFAQRNHTIQLRK